MKEGKEMNLSLPEYLFPKISIHKIAWMKIFFLNYIHSLVLIYCHGFK